VKKKTVAEIAACLNKITLPILVIWGKQDTILPLANGEAAMQKMINGRLHVINQAGHFPQIDKPEEFNATVIHFLKE
jgi:pimeloyl-ACP methyl ester carboxylesterase